VFAVIHPVAALYCPTCPAHQSSAVCSHSARYSDCYFRPVRLCFTRRLSFRLSVGNFTEKNYQVFMKILQRHLWTMNLRF